MAQHIEHQAPPATHTKAPIGHPLVAPRMTPITRLIGMALCPTDTRLTTTG